MYEHIMRVLAKLEPALECFFSAKHAAQIKFVLKSKRLTRYCLKQEMESDQPVVHAHYVSMQNNLVRDSWFRPVCH